MNTRQLCILTCCGALWLSQSAQAIPAGSTIGYQGHLTQGGVPVTDTCDFEFTLWSDGASQNPADQVGPTLLFDGQAGNSGTVDVEGGLFQVALDFGVGSFGDEARWLEISVRCPTGTGDYTTLSPRDRLLGSPYAIHTRGIAVDENGQVGVGTPSPREQLDVAGNTRLALEGTDAFIELVSDEASDATTMRLTSLNSVGLAVTDSRNDPLMVVTERGNVGIGTSNPRAHLEIQGANDSLIHAVNSRSEFIVSNEGQVGIGTNLPRAALDTRSTSGNPALLATGAADDTVALIEGTAPTILDTNGIGETVLKVRGEGTKLLEVAGSGRFFGNHIALFDSRSGSQSDGIAIRLDNPHTNRHNNFVTFLNGRDLVTGRIEGFDLESGDWVAPPPIPDVNFAVDAGVSYNPNWFSPGTLPSASLAAGRLPFANFDPGELPVPDFDPGTPPSLSFNDGSLPTANLVGGSLPSASLNAGSYPTLDFDDGTRPTLTHTTCSAAGVSVICGISFSRGASPTADLEGGSLPTLSFNDGSFPSLAFSPGTLPSANFSPGTLPSFSSTRGTLPSLSFGQGELPGLSFNAGSLPQVLSSPLQFGGASFTFDPPTEQELEDLYCWAFETGNSDYLSLDPVGVAVTNLRQSVMSRCKDEGVTYGSKGADYAEWLPKLNPDDEFQFAQIVGVHGGKVSLKTEGAEQIMAISRAPVVVGNVPPEKDKGKFVTVGFMGQLPVVVRGKVRAGDFIIPSGLDDGTAVAVSPSDLTLQHLGTTLGRAWSESDNDIYSLINVVIGVNANETKYVLQRQAKWNAAQQERQSELMAENERLRRMMAQTDERLEALTLSIQSLKEQIIEKQNCPQQPVVAGTAAEDKGSRS